MQSLRFGAIEAGGTKFLCSSGSLPEDLADPVSIPTRSPSETMAQVLSYFRDVVRTLGPLQAIGIASFGPAGVDPIKPDWGSILVTPKAGWSNTNLVQPLQQAFGVPVGFDTDVNGAALAEARWGAGVGKEVVVYVTVGTGVGAGVVVQGRALHGASHPEAAHFRPPRHPADIRFEGICPFHGDCLEGLASGPAIEKRWGVQLSALSAGHEAYEIIAHYLGHFVTTLQAILAPNRIIFGGGVTNAPGLIAKVHKAATLLGAGYFANPEGMEQLVVPPGLGTRSGLLGAVHLAGDAIRDAEKNRGRTRDAI